jgi:hypothetical protein
MRCLFDPIPLTMTLPWRGYLFDVTIYMGQSAYVLQIWVDMNANVGDLRMFDISVKYVYHV